MAVGKVYLVGAGPGDPGLLTVKGRDCIASADVIVYDRLMSPRLLTYARPETACYYVGKAASDHELPQDEIQSLLIRLAADGKRVVRLKGGDPYVFGRGAEEAMALESAGIPWEVVPGVTSAVSVPAYAGIPVTHRDMAPAFTVVTGHRYRSGDGMDAHWRAMDVAEGTLVILMGVGQLPQIVHRLRSAGRPADTPIALIRWGTRAEQRTLTGQLVDIVERAEADRFQSPAIIVVGEAVTLRADLNWYERLPFVGLRGLVLCDTRADGEAAVTALAKLGVEALDISVEAMVRGRTPCVDGGVDEMLSSMTGRLGAERLQMSVWFSTKSGVVRFVDELVQRDVDTRRLHSLVIGAANEAVGSALRQVGLWIDWTGPVHTGPGGHGQFKWVESTGAVDDKWVSLDETARPLHLFDDSEPPGASDAFIRWVTSGIDFVWVTSDTAYALARKFALCPDPRDRDSQVVWFNVLDSAWAERDNIIVAHSAADVCRETASRLLPNQVVVP